ncbi:MAG: hypothetical protein ACOYNL_05335 [Rickettsiales bacterium]
MLLPIGIWILSVIFATYFGHGLLVQLGERRARVRWYVWEPDDKRSYLSRAEKPVDYWMSLGVQSFAFSICIYGAMKSL